MSSLRTSVALHYITTCYVS